MKPEAHIDFKGEHCKSSFLFLHAPLALHSSAILTKSGLKLHKVSNWKLCRLTRYDGSVETWRNKQRGRRWWSLKFWARNVRRWYRTVCGSVLWSRIWSGSVCLCWYYKESGKVDLGYYLTLSLNHRRDLLLLVLCIQHNVIFHWYWAVARLSSTNRWLCCYLWCLDRRLCFSCTGGETTSSLAISSRLTVSVF